jgi:hypothetical protein
VLAHPLDPGDLPEDEPLGPGDVRLQLGEFWVQLEYGFGAQLKPRRR